jgi:hypothetical protein
MQAAEAMEYEREVRRVMPRLATDQDVVEHLRGDPLLLTEEEEEEAREIPSHNGGNAYPVGSAAYNIL